MADTILHKRSSVAAKVPTAGDLSLGELAINAADGRLFLKKVNGTVVDITSIAGIIGLSDALAGKLDTNGNGSALTNLNASAISSGTIPAARVPTLNQNTTGSAAKLTTARTLSITGDATWSVSFNGSANASAALTLAATGVTAGTYPKVTVDAKGRVTAGAALVAGDIPTLNQNTTGNAATATALQTPRTINGVSFNGTANITVADATKLPLAGGTMTGAITFAAGQTWPTFNQNTTGNAATATQWATARTLTIGNTGKAVSGAANVTWTLAEIGAAALASPAFTGTPTAPTAAPGTNTTQIASTAFVTAAVAAGAGIEYGGSPSDVTASRSLDTVYTNTSGKMLLVYYRTTSGTSRTARLVVDGGAAYVGVSTGSSVNSTSTVYAIVPPGGTYEATGGTGAINEWIEMELV